MKLGAIAVAAVAGVAGLCLVGAGSHAVFTQATVSNEQITAGTMNVVLSLNGPATDASGPTLTMPPVGPSGSSFTTGDQTVTITNRGTISVNEVRATPGDNHTAGGANTALHDQLYLCEVSSGQVIYNGPLKDAPSQLIGGVLTVGATDNYTVNYYAGNETTACGAVTTTGAAAVSGTSHAPSLSNEAQGGVVDPTLTVSYTG